MARMLEADYIAARRKFRKRRNIGRALVELFPSIERNFLPLEQAVRRADTYKFDRTFPIVASGCVNRQRFIILVSDPWPKPSG